METKSSVTNDAAAIIEGVTRLHGSTFSSVEDPRKLTTHGVPLLLRPTDMTLQSLKPLLDEYLPHPERRTGHAQLRDQASFVAFVHRFADARQSAIFADPSATAPRLTAMFDYHGDLEKGEPGFCEHRATFACQLSDEWKAWLAVNGKTMGQRDFAAFLEDRIGDVVLVSGEDEQLNALTTLLAARMGGPSALMQLARGLAINVTSKVQQAVTLETGEISVKYDEVHSDGEGAPIKTPNLFFIAIPVFYGGDPYRIPIRIRYRVDGGAILWSAHLYRPDKALDDAFQQIVTFVRAQVAPTVFLGTPGNSGN